MKLLIVGSRSIKEFDLSPHISEETEVILSVGAMGIDRLAEEYADKHRLSKIILRPRYKACGKFAPLKRNMELVQLADRVLIVWDGRSKGTAFTIKYAQKLGKSTKIIVM